ncbi:MAG TPA: S8 family serine peptidase [Anaerolineae bacterium]
MYNADNNQLEAKHDTWGAILAIVLFGWIVLLSFFTHLAAWTAGQAAIILGERWPPWAGLLVTLGQGLALALPLLPLAWRWRYPRYRAVFQTWALAAVFVSFLAPAHLTPLNATQLGNLLQIVGTLLYLGLLLFLIHRRKSSSGKTAPPLPHSPAPLPPPRLIRPQPLYLPALALAPLFIYGWLAWGALGSWLDTLLNLAAALLFGLAAGLLLGHVLLPALRQTSTSAGWNITLGGFVVGAALAAMSAAFGFNGMQLLLMLALPALAWVLPALSYLGRPIVETSWLALALLIGLVAAAPMLLIDPDELVLVLNVGGRDVLTWAIYAVLVGVFVGWLAGFVLFLLRHRLPRWRAWSFWAGAAGASWLLAALVYFLVGQPGLYGEQLFVILRDQADVVAATTVAGDLERRQFVYESLVTHADDTQAEIRAILDRFGIDYTPYYLVNALAVDAGPPLRLWLEARPEVDRVLDNPVLRPLPALSPSANGNEPAPTAPQWNLTSIGAERVWNELGVRGEGIVVGQSDSGAQWTHPELNDGYRGGAGEHDYNWFDPWYHTARPFDISGHGTHTLGSVLGESVGVAPGATWFGCANLVRNLANPALYLDCMQFMLAPFPLDGDPFRDGDPALGAHVLNNSWGCPDLEGCDATALLPATRALRAAGIFTVASAGNEGSDCGSVDSPLALYDEAFSAGAVDVSGQVAFFSSRGPVTADGSFRLKPDIVAPGMSVLSSMPDDTYGYNDGTSMAGPHVTGVVALMWSANPGLIGNVELTERILAETAAPYDYGRHGIPDCADSANTPNNAVGYGIVDAYAAVQRALELDQ